MTLTLDKAYEGLKYITADGICSQGAAIAAFTTRCGGVSGLEPGTEHLKSLNLQYAAQGEGSGNVDKNYEIISSALGFEAGCVASVHQKHTDKVALVDKQPDLSWGGGGAVEEADALVTNIEGILLSVRTADCVPILLFDSENNAVAAIHSGWRGTFSQIAAKALSCMAKAYGTNPAGVHAAIGPAIGACCYEVGSEVYESFATEHGEGIGEFFSFGEHGLHNGEKPHCDLKAMNKHFLAQAGVPEGSIEVSEYCTQCHPELFFSHRRSGFKRGAMAAFIGIRKGNL